MNMKQFVISIPLVLFLALGAAAQPFTLEAQINNQPKNTIVLGSLRGDDFTAIDSFEYSRPGIRIRMAFPENAKPGMYRLVLGKTGYSKVMGEPPQQLDFIFNNENIAFETDFKFPENSLHVVYSDENRAWFDFRLKDHILVQNIKMLEKELNHYWQKNDTANAIKKADQYNRLQMERDLFVAQAAQQSKGMLVAPMIKNQRQPVLDGYLTMDERKAYYHQKYFDNLDFSDERLINSTIYSDNVFKYLVSYNHPDFDKKQREKAYKKAVDVILRNALENEKVHWFIVEYLIDGFEVLEMENVIEYIAENRGKQ